MKAALVLVSLLVVLGLSEAFVCPPDICKGVSCSEAPTVSSCPGTLVPNSSFCGCCSTCYKQLPKGSRCTLQVLMVPASYHREVCEEGTTCVNNVCVPYTQV